MPTTTLTPATLLQSAEVFAREHIENIRRGSGESYAEHGREVASVLSEITDDASLFRVATVHDILEHPDGEKLLNQALLTDDERSLVRQMYRLRRRHIDENTDDLDLVIDAFLEDPRVMFLRMAHRMNDIRHLDRFRRDRRRELAHETLHMYSAISGHLGFHRWRWQMEDICFQELQPRTFRSLQKQFRASESVDHTCLEHTRLFLIGKLQESGLTATIDWRIKGIYSTYRKMVLKQRTFFDLTDRLALRILLPTVDDCYRALGIVHAAMHPVPAKLKDYIGLPKANGYRSIHTAVYPLAGVTELPIEIQIRTHDMHRECEGGVAAHGTYKNVHYALSTKTARVNLFRNREHLRSFSETPADFERALRTSFSDEDMLIFDDKDQCYHIHPPATALDFACTTLKLDPRIVEAVRINGRALSLSTVLRDGDTVRVITGKVTMSREQLIRSCHHIQSRKLIRDAWQKSV